MIIPVSIIDVVINNAPRDSIMSILDKIRVGKLLNTTKFSVTLYIPKT